MPHTARKIGESGVYHVVTKGDGGQIIFEDEGDRVYYLKTLEQAVGEYKVDLNAYCLMSNHVHLLIRVQESAREQDGGKELSAFMKRLNESYAMYYQKKSQRVGHVFKGRFWSETVDTDEYFLSAVRYIHANPEHAGICMAENFRWSSYQAYCGKPSFVDVELGLNLLGGVDGFRDFSRSGGQCALPFPGSKLVRHLSPDEQARIAVELLGRNVITTLRQMKAKERNPHIAKLAAAGFSATEIARLTGLGRQAVRSALEK